MNKKNISHKILKILSIAIIGLSTIFSPMTLEAAATALAAAPQATTYNPMDPTDNISSGTLADPTYRLDYKLYNGELARVDSDPVTGEWSEYVLSNYANVPAPNVDFEVYDTANTLVDSFSVYLVDYEQMGGTYPIPQVTKYDAYSPEGGLLIAPPSPSIPNYVFTGWSTTEDGSSGLWNFETDTTPGEPITLYAQYELDPQYALSVDPMVPGSGTLTGTGAPNTPVTLYNSNGGAITTVITNETGKYTFTGLAPGTTNNLDVEVRQTVDGEESVVKMHTVAYTSAPEFGTPTLRAFVEEGANPVLPSEQPYSPTQKFENWAIDSADGAVWDESSVMPNTVVNVYPKFTDWSPTVNPMDPGTTCLTGTGTAGGQIVIAPQGTAPSATPIATTTIDTNGNWSFCDLDITNNQNVMVYETNAAGTQVSKSINLYAVNYLLEGSTGNVNSVYAEEGSTLITPEDPTLTDNIFVSWNTDKNVINNGYDFTAPMPANPVTLYATFVPVDAVPPKPTVDTMIASSQTMIGNANPNATVNIKDLEGNVLLTTTAKDDSGSFKFDNLQPGVTTPNDIMVTQVDAYTGIESEPVIMHVVDFDANGAVVDGYVQSNMNSVYVEEGTAFFNPANNPNNIYSNGLRLDGWSTTADGASGNWDFATQKMGTEPIVLYAQWSDLVPTANPMDPSQTCLTGTGELGYIQIFDSNVENGPFMVSTLNGDDTFSSCDIDTAVHPTILLQDNSYYTSHLSGFVTLNTVTYDLNGGTASNINTVYAEEGALLIEPEVPTKTNYEFVGWSTSVDGSTDMWDYSSTKMGSAPTTLYAQWRVIPPTVDPLVPGDTCLSGTGIPGDSIVITDTNGNVIDTITIDDQGNWEYCGLTPGSPDDLDVTQVDPDGNESTPVVFHTVNYDTKGGNETIESVYVAENTLAVEPTVPTRTDYLFKGWSTSENGETGTYDFLTPITATTTLYAQWELFLPPVVNPINPDDTCITGTGNPGDSIVITDSEGNVIETIVIGDTGEWEYCNATPGSPDDLVITGVDPDGNETTPVVLHTVYFNTNDGTRSTSSVYVVENSAVTAPAQPTRSGYKFSSWSTSLDGTTGSYDFATPVTATTTLYAQWTEFDAPVVNPINPEDTCISGTGNQGDTIVITDAEGNVIETIVIGESGEWEYCDVTPGAPNDLVITEVDPDGNESTPVTLHTVNYDTNGSNETVPSTYVVENNTATEPTEPKRSGYTFNGWSTSIDGASGNYDFTTPITATTTLYAQWTTFDAPVVNPINPEDTCISGSGEPGDTIVISDADGNVIETIVIGETGEWEYCDMTPGAPDDLVISQVDPDGNTSNPTSLHTVNFDTNGGNETISSVYVVDNTTVATPTQPTHSSLVFNGWSTSVDGSTGIYDFNTPVTATTTLYAQWTTFEAPVVNPTNPDTGCITGTGTPGNSIVVKDANGNVIETVVIGEDGTYSICNLEPGNPNDITITEVSPGGNSSVPVSMHTFKFDVNGGDNPIDSIYVTDGTWVSMPDDPTREGYRFVGWNTKADGTGDMWDFANNKADASYTLYAQWELVDDSIEVTPSNPDGNSNLVETGLYTLETISFGFALIGLAILSLRKYSNK
jgi:uncharacterized repeat protein (TIGR02543 family)